MVTPLIGLLGLALHGDNVRPELEKLDDINLRKDSIDIELDRPKLAPHVVLDADRPFRRSSTPGDWFGTEDREAPLKNDSRSWQSMCQRTNTPFNSGGWETETDFYRAIAQGLHPHLDKRTMFEGIASDGGFAVPSTMAATIMDTSLESEIVRPRANVVPMATNEHKIAMWDDSDRSSSELYGGIAANWAGESSTLTTDDANVDNPNGPVPALREHAGEHLG